MLYRVFLLRVIDLDAMTAEGDTARLLSQCVAILAGISFLFALPLIFISGLPPIDIWTTEHLLIATTITVVGLFSVLSWDSLVPDRRDVLVLSPLPIRTITLFSAKLAAIAASLGLVIGSLNVFTGMFWPLLFAPSAGIAASARSLAAYWATVVLAGMFTFCLVLSVRGIAAQVLSRQLYLRLSALLQVSIFSLFVGLYFLEPSLEAPEALTAANHHRLLACLPSYWFLGLFQQLNGSISDGFSWLAQRAWTGLAVAACAAFGAQVLTYFRTLRKLVEEPDILPSSRSTAWWLRHGDATQTAILFFSLRTLFRSRQHRLIASFYLGFGGAAVLAYTRVALGDGELIHGVQAEHMRVPVLSTSILLMCVAIAAIRVVFSIPISLGANWIFRMTELLQVPQYVSAVRRTLIFMSIGPAWLLISIVLVSIWPPALAAEHLLALALFGCCLGELSLLGFQKVPFTCSYLPGKANAHIVFWVSVLLLVPLANQIARLEAWTLDTPLRWACLMLLLCILWAGARRQTQARASAANCMKFEEMPNPDIFALKLDRS